MEYVFDYVCGGLNEKRSERRFEDTSYSDSYKSNLLTDNGVMEMLIMQPYECDNPICEICGEKIGRNEKTSAEIRSWVCEGCLESVDFEIEQAVEKIRTFNGRKVMSYKDAKRILYDRVGEDDDI